MKNKIFVITDERCGGTEIGNLFSMIGYKVIDDPQTIKKGMDPSIYNKDNVLNNINYFFTVYDYVKICMVSYTEEEYIKILKDVINLNCKILFLWRRNHLERGLSKSIAIETGVWTKKDYNRIYKGVFRIDMERLRNLIDENKRKVTYVFSYLKNNDVNYFPVLYENIYNKELNGDQRLVIFYKILDYVDPIIVDNISVQQYSKLVERLCPCKKVNDLATYSRISNINEIIKEFSNNENGIITFNKNVVHKVHKHYDK